MPFLIGGLVCIVAIPGLVALGWFAGRDGRADDACFAEARREARAAPDNAEHVRSAYRKYLVRWPEGRNVPGVKKRLAALASLVDRTFKATEAKAKDAGDGGRRLVGMYRDYLASYPNGKWSKYVERELNALDKRFAASLRLRRAMLERRLVEGVLNGHSTVDAFTDSLVKHLTHMKGDPAPPREECIAALQDEIVCLRLRPTDKDIEIRFSHSKLDVLPFLAAAEMAMSDTVDLARNRHRAVLMGLIGGQSGSGVSRGVSRGQALNIKFTHGHPALCPTLVSEDKRDGGVVESGK